MPTFVMLNRDQLRLEDKADLLLRSVQADANYPASTEYNLTRRARFEVSLDSLAEWAIAPGQSFRDELQFLMSVSSLPRHLRVCVRLWANGHSQSEIALAIRVSQSVVSERIRSGLRICYDLSPITFRRFSQHTIYRAPTSRATNTQLSRCVRCGAQFAVGIGFGRHCSSECRQASFSNRRRRKNWGQV